MPWKLLAASAKLLPLSARAPPTAPERALVSELAGCRQVFAAGSRGRPAADVDDDRAVVAGGGKRGRDAA